MRILLINPSGGPEEEYGALSKAGSNLPQLGLAAIGTSLRNEGHQVKVIDYYIQGLGTQSLLDDIKKEKYSLIGFSVYVTSVKKTHQFAKKIKSAFPNIKICIGGPQATLQPYSFYKEYIDYIFVGEADRSIVELANFLEKGVTYPKIKGLLYNAGKSLEGSAELNLIEDLDSLPFIEIDKFYDLSNYQAPVFQRGRKIINLVSSRGCPFSCSFCAAAEINGRKLRQMSAARFVDYVEIYVKKGYDSFMFYDDTFTINKKRVVEISKEIIKKKLKISWNCWSRVDCIERETLSYMRDAGCYLMVFGCESMNDKTLTLLRKGFTSEQSLKGIEMVKNAGILTVSSFMVGLPRETEQDIMNTVKIVNRSRLDIALWPIFEPYKGTPIYEVCEKEGQWIKDSRFRNAIVADQEEVWEPYSISRGKIEKLAQYAFRTFYFRPYFLESFFRIFTSLPLDRKIRFISSGMDYFVYTRLPLKKKNYKYGSRYR